MAQQPARQIVEIVGAFAQEGIAQALHAQSHFVLHALDRGFGGKAGAHRVAHALAPALVVGEQAIGFDHFAALARQIEFADEASISSTPSRRDAIASSSRFNSFDRIVGDHALDLDARLVQHDAAHRDAFGQALAHEFARPVDAQLRFVQFGDIEEAALRHHFGQHHGHGLQRLDFFFGINPLGLVLHREHAEHLAAAHNGHAQEGVERVFAGFRAIGEMRIGRRVRQVHRFGGFADQAHQTFAFASAGWRGRRCGLRPSVANSSSTLPARRR